MPKLLDRKQIRLKEYDYSQAGYYFVTVCVENRQQIFGVVENGVMILNETGKMIDIWWQKMFEKYGNISIDEYIIMPNHIHGIINIVGAGSPRPNNDVNNKIIGRGNRAPTIGNVIAYFKYQSTKHINKLRNMPGRKIWQRSFHEHIIRNDKSLNEIREYIQNNPLKWEEDKENPENMPVFEKSGAETAPLQRC